MDLGGMQNRNYIFIFSESQQARDFFFCCPVTASISYCLDGLGMACDKKDHILIPTQPWQIRDLSCCFVDTSIAFSSSNTAGIGWGGIIKFIFLYKSIYKSGIKKKMNTGIAFFTINYCWDGVGLDNKIYNPTYRQTRKKGICFHHQFLLGWGGIMNFIIVLIQRHWFFFFPFCSVNTDISVLSIITARRVYMGWDTNWKIIFIFI